MIASMTARVDSDIESKMVELWEQRFSSRQIATELGVSPTTVLRAIRRNGLKVDPEVTRRRKRRTTAAQDAEIVGRYVAGEGAGSLAREYGFKFHLSVIQRVREAGHVVRPPGPAFQDLTEAEGQEVLRLRNEQGLSQEKIASLIGISQTRISRWLIVNSHRTWPLTRHPQYGGGLTRTSSGYLARRVQTTDKFASMASRNGYVPEHRYVMAEALGRPLTKRETVHHINGDRTDNRLENLQLRHGQHGKGVMMACLDCGSRNVGATPLSAA